VERGSGRRGGVRWCKVVEGGKSRDASCFCIKSSRGARPEMRLRKVRLSHNFRSCGDGALVWAGVYRLSQLRTAADEIIRTARRSVVVDWTVGRQHGTTQLRQRHIETWGGGYGLALVAHMFPLPQSWAGTQSCPSNPLECALS